MYELIQKVVGEIHEHNWYKIPSIISTILIIVLFTLYGIGQKKIKDPKNSKDPWVHITSISLILTVFPIVHIFMLLLMLGIKNWD